MEFNQPGIATGDKIEFKNLIGRLLLIYVKELKPDITTTMGVREALVTDVVILDGPTAGEELFDSFVFPNVLISQLKKYIGDPTPALGRLAYGEGKPGQNPPYKLGDWNDTDAATARAWLAQHPRNTFNKPAQQSPPPPPPQNTYQENPNYGGGYRDYSGAQNQLSNAGQPPAAAPPANVNQSTGEVRSINIGTIRTLIGLGVADAAIAQETGATVEQITAIRNLPQT